MFDTSFHLGLDHESPAEVRAQSAMVTHVTNISSLAASPSAGVHVEIIPPDADVKYLVIATVGWKNPDPTNKT